MAGEVEAVKAYVATAQQDGFDNNEVRQLEGLVARVPAADRGQLPGVLQGIDGANLGRSGGTNNRRVRELLGVAVTSAPVIGQAPRTNGPTPEVVERIANGQAAQPPERSPLVTGAKWLGAAVGGKYGFFAGLGIAVVGGACLGLAGVGAATIGVGALVVIGAATVGGAVLGYNVPDMLGF